MLTDLEKNAIRDHYRTISENLPHFRPRHAQREMLAAIANAFSRTLTREDDSDTPPERQGESIVVIEGPTGVGKSLAYLLSGGIMAQTRGKRLIPVQQSLCKNNWLGAICLLWWKKVAWN